MFTNIYTHAQAAAPFDHCGGTVSDETDYWLICEQKSPFSKLLIYSMCIALIYISDDKL